MGKHFAVTFDDYLAWRCVLADPWVEFDFSHAGIDQQDLAAMAEPLAAALAAMQELEAGGIANRDENRMVGHYWLRNAALAPDDALSEEIVQTIGAVETFAQAVRSGQIAPPEGGVFEKAVVIGIGGSALGPLLLHDALIGDGLSLYFADNTDPDGFDRLLERIGSLQNCLIVTISKSGGTKETRNGMLEFERACGQQGVAFAPRAVAISGRGSALWQNARDNGWLATLPMWDWVGGRTSLWSAVGLLPAALAGFDIRGLLAGAAAMDDLTRQPAPHNPAAWMALFWWLAGEGVGNRAMVVLPYKDRLANLSRYLQQLVMESLGKEHDRQGRVVNQGLSVYGNKGSTDQHAFVQQLRDGRNDFFAVFVRVLAERLGPRFEVEPGTTSGDYLDGFWQGTRRALHESGRMSATITLSEVGERSVGALLALFERAVGLYAELIDVNAYHQPGVEAGKKAAAEVLEVQTRLLGLLRPQPQTAAALWEQADADPVVVWSVLQHLAINHPGVHAQGLQGPPMAATFRSL